MWNYDKDVYLPVDNSLKDGQRHSVFFNEYTGESKFFSPIAVEKWGTAHIEDSLNKKDGSPGGNGG